MLDLPEGLLMKSMLIATIALLAVPALAAQAPASTPLNPVGNYQFQVMLPDGNAIGGQFSIKGAPGKWEGTITSDVAPAAPIAGVAVEGQVLMFTINAPDGSALPLRLTFTGHDFSGQLSFQGMDMVVAGKRVVAP
ncbi:MAG: hypothetical protein ABR551_08615 [Gemmatimonadales bacterium]